jgi:hypothetical protein
MYNITFRNIRKFIIVIAIAIGIVIVALYYTKTPVNRVISTKGDIIEGADATSSLSTVDYYVLRQVVNQIKEDDPTLKYNFDISAIMQLPSVISNAAYNIVLNSDTTIAKKIEGINTLLEEEPGKAAIANTKFAPILPSSL